MPEKTIRIAFRGLMVLNYQTDDAGKKYMEIGFLDARTASAQGSSHMQHTAVPPPVHVPRILTMENGLLADLRDLRNHSELGTVRRWQLSVVNPLQTQVTLKGTVPANRQMVTDDNREDFGWIVDLEGRDMHDMNLTSKITTSRLLMVLTVRNGEFSTKLISPPLIRKELGAGETSFGCVAAVTGCDIKCDSAEEGEVLLLAGSTLVKSLKPNPGRTTVFEISNSPPDVPADPPIPGQRSHFRMYYDKLFIQSPPYKQFDFRAVGGAPAPDPALCGVIYLGQRDDPL